MKYQVKSRFSAVGLVLVVGAVVASLVVRRANSQQVSLGSAVVPVGSFLVSYVVDGDTVHVRPSGCTDRSCEKKVRLIGIDAPEMEHDTQQQECFAVEATKELERLVLNKIVTLETDVEDKDQYGRLLRYVWVGGVLANEALVRQGFAYAKYYKPNVFHQDRLITAMNEAREWKRGVWKECEKK